MKWQEVREQFPETWVLIEPKNPRTIGQQRVFEQLDVLGQFSEVNAAWQAYHEIHDIAPMREMFVFHTDKESLEVRVRERIGLRRLA